jgi:hypothetical protein
VWRFIFLNLLMGFWLQGCAQVAPPYEPFKIPRNEFFARTKVVALAPVGFTVNPENQESASTQFESLLDQKLRELGFTVVPSTEYKAIWERLTKQMGGIFDPITGKRDDNKLKTVRGYLLEELRTQHRADALLHPVIQVVKAPFNAGHARWHGTAESIIPEGFLAAFFMADSAGTTSALSLLITIEDMNGVDLYVQAGGIQVLAKLTSGRQFVSIPQNQLLTNAERNKAAVNIALSGLSKGGPQQNSEQETP